MPRKAKSALNPTHPLYQKGVHKAPIGAVNTDGIHWNIPAETDNIIDQLNELDLETKSVLYSRSPVSILVEIGGPLDLPEEERYRRLFDYFAPKVWLLSVLIAQLNKRPVPGAALELSPHLTLFRNSFHRLNPTTKHDDPLDYRETIEQAIYNYNKELSGSDFRQVRRRFSQRLAGQHRGIGKAFSQRSLSGTVTEYSILLFGYHEESCDIKDVLLDRETLIETARISHSIYQRRSGKTFDFGYCARLCYTPLLGHHWLLVVPTPHEDFRQLLEGDLVKKWNLGTTQATFCARPKTIDRSVIGVIEYLELQVDVEGLVHATFKAGTNRFHHSN